MLSSAFFALDALDMLTTWNIGHNYLSPLQAAAYPADKPGNVLVLCASTHTHTPSPSGRGKLIFNCLIKDDNIKLV